MLLSRVGVQCGWSWSDAMAGLILRRSSAAIFNCWFSQSVQAVVSVSSEKRGLDLVIF